MLNSQLPYNQLRTLNSLNLVSKDSHKNLELTCIRSLEYLDGFLFAIEDPQIKNFIKLLRLSDFKYSLELEKEPISLLRLLEGLCSENALNDEQIDGALQYLDWSNDLHALSLNKLSPTFLKSFSKGADQFREKKESNIKSYFTNLTLFTAPQGASILRELRSDLDQVLRNPGMQNNLKSIAMLHYQIRAVAPFNAFNGLVARIYHNMALPFLGLGYDFLPISGILIKKREKYQSLMRDCLIQNDFEEWIQFMMEVSTEAAKQVPAQVKKFMRLKNQTHDLITKYLEYNLPSALVEPLMDMPFVKAAQLMKQIGCHRQTAYTYLKHLVKMGILVERQSGREKLYLFKAYFDLLNE